jgi:YVTN family beta-propeller protein
MKRTIAALVWLTAGIAAPATGQAQNAYVTNSATDNVSVINTATNKVIATIPVGTDPYGVVVSPVGGKTYVTETGAVSSINTSTNTLISTVFLSGDDPTGITIMPDGSKLYVSNWGSGTVSVIDTVAMSLIATVDVGGADRPFLSGIAVSPDGSRVYASSVGPLGIGSVSIIDTATSSITGAAPIDVLDPSGIALAPDGSKLYVVGVLDEEPPAGSAVDVIDTGTNTLLTTIALGSGNFGIFGLAVSPDGTKLYVSTSTNANGGQPYPSGAVSVIDLTTDSVIATVPLPSYMPFGLAVTPDGTKVYVANHYNDTVAVIDTATNSLRRFQIHVGGFPTAFGDFIIRPSFAGTPGDPTCRGQTRAALAVQFGSVDAAAAALGFYNVTGLRRSVRTFCGGNDALADEGRWPAQ